MCIVMYSAPVTAKLVCEVLVLYCRIWCSMFIVRVLVLDKMGQCRIEGTGIVGTRTVHVPGNGEPYIQGARTRTVPVPGSGEPNIQGARTEPFRYPSVRV